MPMNLTKILGAFSRLTTNMKVHNIMIVCAAMGESIDEAGAQEILDCSEEAFRLYVAQGCEGDAALKNVPISKSGKTIGGGSELPGD